MPRSETNTARVGNIIQMCADGMVAFNRQKAEVKRVDAWMRGEQFGLDTALPGLNVLGGDNVVEGRPYMPRGSNAEFTDLATRATNPFGKLVVSSLAQTIYFEGARLSGQDEDAELDCVKVLRHNNWNARQLPLTRATIGHGIAYVKALPGVSEIDGSDSAMVRPVSAMRMAAFYDNLDDDWASYAIEVDDFQIEIDGKMLTNVTYFDDSAVHNLWFEGEGEDVDDWIWAGIEQIHDLGVTPIIRFANLMDLEGRATGEIAPIIPLLRSLDQDTFDRLVVQRYGAWKVRYISGMTAPEGTSDAAKEAKAIQLKLQDILISPSKDTKFGTLEETQLTGFIEARDADLRVLAAVTQTPPHHLLGLSSNLQAEALAAAEAGLQRKSLDFQIFNSGSYQQLLRLIAKIRKNREEATADNIETRYRDTESRSLVQAAQALGTLATQLKVPVEMLWNRIPGWSEDDSKRALKNIEEGGVAQILAAFEALNGTPGAGDAAPTQTSDQSASTS